MRPASLRVSFLQARSGRHADTCAKLTTALLATLLLASSGAIAAPSPKQKAEIAQLMAALSASGCQFQRNGSWHDAAEARAHLQRKYDYLLKRDKVETSEQFIERAASRSSSSGRTYRVRCQGREQEASAWFSAQLQRLRGTGAGAH